MLIDLPSFAVGGLFGAAVAAIIWGILRWQRTHRSRDPVPPPDGAEAAPAPVLWVGRTSVPSPAGDPVRSVVSVAPDQVRLSERVVIALAREGRLGDDTPIRATRTQAGLAEALGSSQSAVSKVLRRLVAAELLTEERRHVTGRDQRLKVYALTRRGELLARDLARRRSLSLLPERPQEEGRPTLSANQ